MESATLLAFRIFVMLSCLIIVPMAAIFGSAFPDVVKSVLVDRIVAWSTGKWPETQSSTAPGAFSAVTAGTTAATATSGEAPRWGQANAAAPWQSEAAAQQGVVPAGAMAINPTAVNQSVSFAVPVEPARGTPAVTPERAGGDPFARHAASETESSPKQPGAFPLGGPVHQDARGETPRGAAAVDQPERFTAIQRRLRECGATYYLLETWGNEGELYRFHCKMAAGSNPNYTRQFEATDHDALKAMAQVLEKVELWREGRLQ